MGPIKSTERSGTLAFRWRPYPSCRCTTQSLVAASMPRGHQDPRGDGTRGLSRVNARGGGRTDATWPGASQPPHTAAASDPAPGFSNPAEAIRCGRACLVADRPTYATSLRPAAVRIAVASCPTVAHQP